MWKSKETEKNSYHLTSKKGWTPGLKPGSYAVAPLFWMSKQPRYRNNLNPLYWGKLTYKLLPATFNSKFP